MPMRCSSPLRSECRVNDVCAVTYLERPTTVSTLELTATPPDDCDDPFTDLHSEVNWIRQFLDSHLRKFVMPYTFDRRRFAIATAFVALFSCGIELTVR